MPRFLNLAEERILVLLSALLDLLALRLEVRLQTLGVPRVVGLSDVVFPAVLDEVLQVLAVGRGGVWDVVIRQPPLQLSLVPFVVRCAFSCKSV